MLTRRLVFLAFAVMLIAGCKQEEDKEPVPTGSLAITPERIDFGEVAQGEVVEKTATVKNTGGIGLLLGPYRFSCPCTTARAENTYLSPGEETTLHISIDTSANPGGARHSVMVMTDDRNVIPVSVLLVGTVLPELVVTPELHRLLYAEDNTETYTLESTVKNALKVPSVVTNMEVNGEGMTAELVGCPIPCRLAPDAQVTLRITAKSPDPTKTLTGRVILGTETGAKRFYSILVTQDTQPMVMDTPPPAAVPPTPPAD